MAFLPAWRRDSSNAGTAGRLCAYLSEEQGIRLPRLDAADTYNPAADSEHLMTTFPKCAPLSRCA